MTMVTNNIIVNFFGGPGVGKTTAAADLFSSLKKNGVETQLVGEFAQECVLEGNVNALDDQIYIFGNTWHRMLSAYSQSAVTVIDSPVLLSCVYQEGFGETFNKLVVESHNRLQNLNVLLDVRDNQNHTMVGRIHDLNESIAIDNRIESMLTKYSIPYVRQSELLQRELELIPYLTEQILEYIEETPAAVAE